MRLRIADYGLRNERGESHRTVVQSGSGKAQSIPAHPAEGSAAAAVAPRPGVLTALATLLTSHILQDGEIVHLILKPSLWYLILSGLRFYAAVTILVVGGALIDERVPGKDLVYLNIGAVLVTGRLLWAVLQWMGKVYVLTDRRILSLSGVFTIDVFDCPLRKVARTRILYTTRERVMRLGTIQIIPGDDEMIDGLWQMIARSAEAHETVVAAINRAKQSGLA